MSLSKNPNAYIHTKPILDAAVEHGGGTYTLRNHKEALMWRAHANAYRSIISESGPTNYDGLQITIDDYKVVFVLRKVNGTFTTEDGTVLDIEQKAPEPDDSLLKAVQDFALEIGGPKND
jgi:hypothetical protein